MSAHNLPKVSVLIPMWNEAKYIEACLESVLHGEYPLENLQIVVIDGMSNDGSRQIAERYARRFSQIGIIDNRKGVTPVAMNLGIQASSGDIVVWLSAHAVYNAGYIRRSVELLRSSGAACVGGVLEAAGDGYVGGAIAVAACTPFAVGDARYRYAEQPCWVDTVFGGAWRKTTLQELGGFDEKCTINSDYEFNYRLRQRGGHILLSPQLRCQYFVRGTLFALHIQYLRYGQWKVRTLMLHPEALRWRQLVPPVFIFSLLGSVCVLPLSPVAGAIMPAIYMLAATIASLRAGALRGWRYLPLLPVIFALIHLSWGAGFMLGVIRFGVPKFSWHAIRSAFGSVDKTL